MRCEFVEHNNQCWCQVCLSPLKYTPAMQRATGHVVAAVVRDCMGPPPPPAEQPAVPSLATRVLNGAKAVGKAVRNRNLTITDEQIAERVRICVHCPTDRFHRHSPDTLEGTCTHPQCGCPISPMRRLRNKAARPEQTCPDGHWPNILPE